MTVLERLREELGEDVDLSTSIDSLDLDSLDLLSIYVEFRVPRSESLAFETVGDLVGYVEARTAI